MGASGRTGRKPLTSQRTPHGPTSPGGSREGRAQTGSSGDPSPLQVPGGTAGTEGCGHWEGWCTEAGGPLASTEADSGTQNTPGRGFLGLQWRGLLSETIQGLPHGGIQGGGRVDGDAGGPDAGFPAVKPAVSQSLLHGLYLRLLQIWGEGKQQVTPQSSAPLGIVHPGKGPGPSLAPSGVGVVVVMEQQLKSWAPESHGPGLVTDQPWGLRPVTCLL